MVYGVYYSLRFQLPTFQRIGCVNKAHWRRSTCIDFPEGANWEAAAEAQGHQHARTSLNVISAE